MEKLRYSRQNHKSPVIQLLKALAEDSEEARQMSIDYSYKFTKSCYEIIAQICLSKIQVAFIDTQTSKQSLNLCILIPNPSGYHKVVTDLNFSSSTLSVVTIIQFYTKYLPTFAD